MSRRALFLSAIVVSMALRADAASAVKLTQDKKTIALPQVSAVRFVPNEGPAQIFLLFSDVPQTGLTTVGPFGEEMLTIPKWIEQKPAHVAQVKFTEGDQANYSLSIYGDGSMVGGGGHASGGEVTGAFKRITLGEQKIAGEVKAEASNQSLAGTFDVQPQTIHEATAVKGAAVAATPQAAAVLGFVRAMSKFDLKAAQVFSARDLDAQFAKAKEEMGEKLVREMAKEMIGDPVKIAKQLKSKDAVMLEAGDRAQIRVTETIKNESGHGSSTNTFSLRKVAGQWKVD